MGGFCARPKDDEVEKEWDVESEVFRRILRLEQVALGRFFILDC